MSYPLGVDIGTTYTAAALWRDGRVQTVPLGNRANAVPSVLLLREDGTVLVGEAAARRGITEPDRVAREFKRRMGDEIPILVGDRDFTAQQLMARVLRWVVDQVSESQGGPPSHVVLTHPAEWGDFRRRLLVDAAAMAGLRDVGLLAEPVAAATWYASQERVEPGSLIGIYDFGGGTFDASVVRKTDTGIEIVGEPGGDDGCGGVDLDYLLFRYVCSSAGVDSDRLADPDPTTASALAQVLASVVEAKEALSTDVEAIVPVVLPGLAQQVMVPRGQFEDLVRERVLGTVGVFGQVLHRAGVEPSALRTVLLVGGSSRMPIVQHLLRTELGIRVAVDAHPKYAVSLGAAIAAAPRVAPVPAVTPRSGPPSWQPTAGPAPAVAERIDLAVTGLTTPTDIRIHLTPPVRNGQSVVVSTRDAAGRGAVAGRLTALFVVVVVIAAVVLIGVVLHHTAVAGTAVPVRVVSGHGDVGTPTAGTIGLTGQLVVPPAGPDSMRALTAVSGGDVVAVGVSLHLLPRAWVLHAGAWSVAGQPPAEGGQATMEDVAWTGTEAVAVGWTGTGAGRRPAVWTSGNGSAWQLVPAGGDFAPNTGVTELTAITTAPGNGLLAMAVDHRADPADGDTSVYRSTDGRSWTKVAATGLSGPGPQNVYRVALAGNTFVAVGSVLAGAHLGPQLWTSTDGVTWVPSADAPDGSPTLWAVLPEAGGSLLACGSVDSASSPAVGCWRRTSQGTWSTLTVTPAQGTPTPLYVYDIRATGDGTIAVGVGQSGQTIDAAMWTIR